MLDLGHVQVRSAEPNPHPTMFGLLRRENLTIKLIVEGQAQVRFRLSQLYSIRRLSRRRTPGVGPFASHPSSDVAHHTVRKELKIDRAGCAFKDTFA